MNVIILAAGIGSRLYPLTKNTPKCLLKINDDETILGRTLSIIKDGAPEFHIRIIAGFNANQIIEKYDDIEIIVNPFFRITNSIASLWFSKDLLSDEVIIINADVCFNDNIFKMICDCNKENFVVLDSSKNCTDADYKIVVKDDFVTDMGKSIPFDNYSGEYAGITHLNKEGAIHLRNKLEEKLSREEYDTWYETAICELIKENCLKVSVLDIAGQNWIEVDSENELIYAQKYL
ncbi:phosphocholine cytidylyltransferase family protein [Methanogenium cariaci]|uniref:phosphocholine cytidylyltransferase family protein n=1 Tax=Methanogenium cariaci TaxID=2197 RepID=UPI00078389D6|nr:phosphocholine cytidylyltransferase family protein [Methanogenium cariaci]